MSAVKSVANCVSGSCCQEFTCHQHPHDDSPHLSLLGVHVGCQGWNMKGDRAPITQHCTLGARLVNKARGDGPRIPRRCRRFSLTCKNVKGSQDLKVKRRHGYPGCSFDLLKVQVTFAYHLSKSLHPFSAPGQRFPATDRILYKILRFCNKVIIISCLSLLN